MPDIVLVIEDNAANAKLVREVLEHAGYDVVVADDATEGVELAGRLHPAVVVMDVQLPGLDGLTATRRLRADPSTRELVIIAVTAHAMPGDEADARAAGCDGYLHKPLDYRELLEVVACRGN
jgi:CheY-like chemotaxis protein